MSSTLGYSMIEDNIEDKNCTNRPANKIRNKTIKKRSRGDITNKAKNFLKSFKHNFTHKTNDEDDDDENELTSPYNPELYSDSKTSNTEDGNQNVKMEVKEPEQPEYVNQINNDDTDENNMLMRGLKQLQQHQRQEEGFQALHQMRKEQSMPYYSEVANFQTPNYVNVNQPHHSKPPQVYDEDLMKKLNYVVHMLEEQQDEKTGSVTEELILYTFLGIFVIFVVDSFAKTSKYKR